MDGDIIQYELTIKTECDIFVEHINTALSLMKEGIHEKIADTLFERFGGEQEIIASHQGIRIRSIRK